MIGPAEIDRLVLEAKVAFAKANAERVGREASGREASGREPEVDALLRASLGKPLDYSTEGDEDLAIELARRYEAGGWTTRVHYDDRDRAYSSGIEWFVEIRR